MRHERSERQEDAGDARKSRLAEELGQARARLAEDGRALGSTVLRALRLRFQALRITFVEAGIWILVGLALCSWIVLASMAALLLAVGSLRRGAAEWSHGAWWSDLAVAAILLATIPIVVGAGRAWLLAQIRSRVRSIARPRPTRHADAPQRAEGEAAAAGGAA